jgi:integrase
MLHYHKTGAKVRIARQGLFEEVLQRILSRERLGSQLLVNRHGRALTYPQFRTQFDKARESLGADWQLRDLRAKAATDLDDLAHAQRLLGHRSRNTTEIYTRDRLGQLVTALRS